MTTLRLVPPVSTDPHALDALRTEVREFIAEQLTAGKIRRQVDCWLTGWDEDFSAGAGRPGLARHDDARRIRRTWPQPPRTVRRHRGTARRRRSRRRTLDRGPADRALAAQVRHRTPETHVPARHRERRVLFRHRDERTRLRIRSGQRAHQGHPCRRRLVDHRHQGVDLRGAPRACVHLPGPHRPGRSRTPARRTEPVHRRPALPGSRHPADRLDERPAPLQRGHPRRRVRRRRDGVRCHRRRAGSRSPRS